MAKKSWFKFYPQSWLGDPELRTLGPEVRGFWMDLLCYMSQAEPVGYLISASGKPLGSESIARLVGIPIGQVELNLKALLDHKICAFDGNLIYSRKMVRDSEKESRLSKSGRDAVQRRYQKKEPIGLPKGMPIESPNGLPIQLEVLDIYTDNIKGNNKNNRESVQSDEITKSLCSPSGNSLPGGLLKPSGCKLDRDTVTSQAQMFLAWYSIYPRKEGRKSAWEKWLRIKPLPTPEDFKRMIAVLEMQKHSDQWSEGLKFIPLPETYISKGRWDQEPGEESEGRLRF